MFLKPIFINAPGTHPTNPKSHNAREPPLGALNHQTRRYVNATFQTS